MDIKYSSRSSSSNPHQTKQCSEILPLATCPVYSRYIVGIFKHLDSRNRRALTKIKLLNFMFAPYF